MRKSMVTVLVVVLMALGVMAGTALAGSEGIIFNISASRIAR